MATVIETEQAATLKLKVETGTTDSGAAKYATRSHCRLSYRGNFLSAQIVSALYG